MALKSEYPVRDTAKNRWIRLIKRCIVQELDINKHNDI